MLDPNYINEFDIKVDLDIKSIKSSIKNENGDTIYCENLYQKDESNKYLEVFNCGKKFVASRLLRNNIDPKFISIVTDFPLDYITKIKKELNI